MSLKVLHIVTLISLDSPSIRSYNYIIQDELPKFNNLFIFFRRDKGTFSWPKADQVSMVAQMATQVLGRPYSAKSSFFLTEKEH